MPPPRRPSPSSPGHRPRYLDLGAGFGAHAVPLARAGNPVTAVDFHAGLLAELHAAAPAVATHEADLIPVRHDAQRALVCCVEAIDAGHVSVTDIVTTLGPDGLRTQLSAYPKLRLAPATVATWATAAGLALDRDATDQGMQLQVFRAPT